jgi:hypothetical protein
MVACLASLAVALPAAAEEGFAWLFLNRVQDQYDFMATEVEVAPSYPLVLYWIWSDYPQRRNSAQGPVGSELYKIEINCQLKTHRIVFLTRYSELGGQGKRIYLFQDRYAKAEPIPSDGTIYMSSQVACEWARRG